jgi:hypothetical protein
MSSNNRIIKCRAETFFRWVDPALDQGRRAHAERDIERRHEPQVQPIGSAQRNPLTDGPANGVRRHEHPLRAGAVRTTELSELIDEGIHLLNVRFSRCPSTLRPLGHTTRPPQF